DLRVDAGVGVLGRILLADPELEVAVPVVWLLEARAERIHVDAGAVQTAELDRQQRGRRERRRGEVGARRSERRDAELHLGIVRVGLVAAAVGAVEAPAHGRVGVDTDLLRGAVAAARIGAPAIVDDAHVAEVEVLARGARALARLPERNTALIDDGGRRPAGATRDAGRPAGA